MKNKVYIGDISDKSQKDKTIFNNFTVTNKKSIWLGLITIYEIQVNEEKINTVINCLQKKYGRPNWICKTGVLFSLLL